MKTRMESQNKILVWLIVIAILVCAFVYFPSAKKTLSAQFDTHLHPQSSLASDIAEATPSTAVSHHCALALEDHGQLTSLNEHFKGERVTTPPTHHLANLRLLCFAKGAHPRIERLERIGIQSVSYHRTGQSLQAIATLLDGSHEQLLLASPAMVRAAHSARQENRQAWQAVR
ncbi:MAG: hypothetical protein DHS20C10_09980 [marine bacterium B5-7]|nr:MAG: hypothetical protein DHS20C10_09980 [marine bacterium B5-7]